MSVGKPSCEQIINILPEPFVVIDRQFRIMAANGQYLRHYGLNRSDEVVGRFCYEVSHHSEVPCSQNGEHCPLETVFRTGQTTQVMHLHFDKEGREEHVQIQATPLFGEEGEVIYAGEYVYPVSQRESDTLLIGRSRPLLRMASLLQRVAPTQTTVLLLGESGVGKECAAQYVHRFSNRAQLPFVIVDCGTLGESLIESELFGHEKGAFTGAIGRKKGLFEAAHGGTLFIDELAELPLPLQTKLLRVLETGTIRRLGGTQYIKVDVRVIAATNRDLQRMVEEGRFREDLYYRLSAFPVGIPPLRERPDDIPALAEHFLGQLEDGDRLLPLAPEVIEVLLTYDYPGNVRELRNIIERAAILAYGESHLSADHIVVEGPRSRGLGSCSSRAGGGTLVDRRHGRLTEQEVMAALVACNGHRGEAARRLGVSERTLYRYVSRLRSLEEPEPLE